MSSNRDSSPIALRFAAHALLLLLLASESLSQEEKADLSGAKLSQLYSKIERAEEEYAERLGKLVQRSWIRDEALFLDFDDGTYALVLSPEWEGVASLGTESLEMPMVVLGNWRSDFDATPQTLVEKATSIVTIAHDAEIRSDAPDTNFANATFMSAGRPGTWSSRAMIRPSPFFIDGVITDADLDVYRVSCSGTLNLRVFPIQTGTSNYWSESSVTWNNAPPTDSSVSTHSFTTGCASGTESFTITSLVQEWNSGARNQNGVRLSWSSSDGVDQGDFVDFQTSENSNPPRLFIAYSADDHGNSCDAATPMSVGTTRSGSLETSGDRDFFEFSLGSSGVVDVWTVGSTDTYGRLYNSSCSLIAEDDDGGSGTNFRITQTLSAGTYFVSVGGYNDTQVGAYILAVDSAPCSYSLTPSSQSFSSSGGSGNFNVNAPNGCSWTASESLSWVSITSGSSGSGNGTVSFSVSTNSSTNPRSGTITAGGQSFNISQSGITCSYSLTPSSQSFSSAGGSGNFNVNAPNGCSWTASETLSWVSITSGSSGSGNGTVSFSVFSNSSTNPRSGSIIAGGQSFNISQSGLSQFTLTVFGSGTGSGAVTGSGINCTITAATSNGTCQQIYDSGTGVSLTASGTSGSIFSTWSGACTGSGSCNLIMTSNKSVTALFTSGFGLIFADGFETGNTALWDSTSP